jgi:hypothetical protein
MKKNYNSCQIPHYGIGYVKKMILSISIILLGLNAVAQTPATLPFTDNFTTSNNWTLVNTGQTNQWFYGSAAGNPANGLYISNDNGATNTFTITTLSVVQAYRDIVFPAGTNPFNVKFDWRANGESCCDYLRVWLVPTTAVITAGTQISAANVPGAIQIGANFNLGTAWASPNFIIPAAGVAGTTKRLVFEWRNDGSVGTQNPGAIDNVIVNVITCPAPTLGISSGSTQTSSTITWTANGPSSNFDIEYGVFGFVPTGTPTTTSTTNSKLITSLTPNTSYHYYVRSVCSLTDMSVWAGPFIFFTGYCQVSTQYAEYTTAFSTTGALTNVTYAASVQPTGSYANQTTSTISTYATQVINFSHTYSSGSHGFKIWVDWNNDLDFDDTGEQVFFLADANATKTGSFTIPAATAGGNYRMRIRSQWGTASSPPPCGQVNYGSTVDFTLAVTTLFSSPVITQAAGTPTCAGGTTISAAGTPGTGIQWYWQTTATGTSIANAYAGPRTVTTNGTYFIRAFDPALNYWVVATSVVVTNFPVATAPPAPVANVNPSCAPAGTILTVPAPASGFVYYWQGTTMGGVSNALNATTPYNATATGTYYVAAYQTATQCWSSTVGLPVTVGTVIPSNPLVPQLNYNNCIGATTIPIIANTILPSGSLTTTLLGDNACTSGAMFNINSNALPVTVSSFDVMPGVTGAQNVRLYYKVGTHVGFETNAAAWTLIGQYPINGTLSTLLNVDVTDFTIPAGTTYGIYLEYNARYTNLPVGTIFSNADLSVVSGSGHCSPFTPILGRAFTGKVYYNSGISGTVNWFSALTGGNNIGSGSPFETVGTSVLPSASTSGSYNFYASSYLDGCYSVSRELVTVSLSNVHVALTPIAATCNNGNDGAVIVSTVFCGTAPFTYSIDGAPFGPQTGMTPGAHTVRLKDALNNESGTYNVVIGNAPAPSAVLVTTVTAFNANISWTATGSETQWNIQWGIPGFTPGIGAEIGSGTSIVTNYLVTPLNPVTYYDVYVSANCGAGTTAGTWTLVSLNTLCAPISTLPWTENFDNLTVLGNNAFPLCWLNENPGVWQTTNAAVSTLTSGPLSGPNYLRIRYSSNATIWTPEFNLVAGETYELSFNWGGDNNSSWDGGVYVNGSQTFTGATLVGAKFVEVGDPTTIAYRPEIFCFTPTTSGVYTFGVKVIENASNWYLSFDDFKLKQVVTVPGIDGSLSACQTGPAVDLNAVVTTTVTDGTWNFTLNPNAVDTMGMFNPASVPGGVHQFFYISKGCSPDTTIATITVVEPSSAGNDGAIVVCRNEPFNLLSGLAGAGNLGGVWTNPNSVVVPNGNAIASNIPGQYNFRYIVSNGVCPADTAKVVVTVKGTCDYLGLEDVAFEAFTMYPNPSSDIVFITNTGSTEVFNYEVLDMNGRVILKANDAINGSTTTELNLSKVEIGVYLIRVFNDEAEKTFRVVKN